MNDITLVTEMYDLIKKRQDILEELFIMDKKEILERNGLRKIIIREYMHKALKEIEEITNRIYDIKNQLEKGIQNGEFNTTHFDPDIA